MDPSQVEVPEIDALLNRDPYLKMYENDIRRRYLFLAIYVNIICISFIQLDIVTRNNSRILVVVFNNTFLIFRYAVFKDYVEKIEAGDGDLKRFTTAYKDFGIHVQDDNSVVAREWAPGAQEVFLTGDFSKRKTIFV